MYRCIGKSRQHPQAVPTQCENISEAPTWRDIYLCHDCANSAPNRNSRPQLLVERDDVDPPNFEEYEVDSFPVRASQDDVDLADFDHLDELDLS